MTRRVRMIIQYDGTAYAGWQRQLTGLGIQQVMEEELAKLTGHKCALHASGRTDSGVHAAAQVAHFDTDCRIPAENWAAEGYTRCVFGRGRAALPCPL